MRYRLPFALAAVKGHARWRGTLGSPLAAIALQDCPNYERHEPLSAQLAARRWRPSGAFGCRSCESSGAHVSEPVQFSCVLPNSHHKSSQ